MAVMAYLAMALAGCADWSRGVSGADAGEAGVPAQSDGGVAFAAVIHPLLLDGCGRCHGTGGEASDTMFVLTGMAAGDHAAAVAFVDVGTPASSRLLLKMGGVGHGGGAVFAQGSPEFATVLRWIEEGASP